VNTLQALFAKIAEQHARVPNATLQVLHPQLGLAYLRLGEQQNCLAHHATKSCLFPIDAGGMHHRPDGAEGAVREFTAALASNSSEPSTWWLLNLACTTAETAPSRT
jgi:hypothetical protein